MKNKSGYIYLLGDWEKDGYFKIGVTRGDIDKRIKKLQTGNGGEIYLVDYFVSSNPFLIETLLHNKHAASRKMNEWFELTFEERIKFKEECQFFEDMLESLSDNPYMKKKLGKRDL